MLFEGGPGCSGMLALFFENGPYKVNPDLTLSANPYSWNSQANVIWVDNPVGAGYVSFLLYLENLTFSSHMLIIQMVTFRMRLR